jgi:hypothetical protein
LFKSLVAECNKGFTSTGHTEQASLSLWSGELASCRSSWSSSALQSTTFFVLSETEALIACFVSSSAGKYAAHLNYVLTEFKIKAKRVAHHKVSFVTHKTKNETK